MSTNTTSSSPHAIIIGAGVAGIAAAIRLRLQGYTVTVFEKNDYPGGKLSAFTQDGFHFDAGPSLFTQPHLIEELFADAGEPIEPYFTYKRVPITCNYFYEDGTRVKAYAAHQLLAKELEEQLGEPPANLHRYLQQSALTYQHIGQIFLQFSLHKKATLLKAGILNAVKHLKWSFLFRSMHSYNTRMFLSAKTVQLFNRYATYNGSNPYKAPAMLSLIPHLEHNVGTFYPKGGMIAITNALYQLAKKKGVQFEFNQPVEKIIRAAGAAKGVVVNGANNFADLVVSNMDVYFTYEKLLGDSATAATILEQERSSSAFIFYWGINTSFAELGLHNIFFTRDYEKEFHALFNTKTAYDDPTIYINITSKEEPGIQAPDGKENWFVMVNAPANMGQDWKAIQALYKKAVLQKLSKTLGTAIEPLIETEQLLTPVTIESKTASYMGSLYGTSSNSKNAAFMRHPNFSKAIKGLYFVGGSVHPGGGIPLCLSSAKIMANLVKATAKHPH